MHTGSREIRLLVVWAAGLAVLIAAILWLNGGRFAYTLDDPYIHLALAENIAEGHYGLNPGEPASPSSSVLWPLLLVPFAPLPFFELVPLLLAGAAIAGAIVVLARWAERRLSPELSGGKLTTGLAILFLVCNFWGMPLNGMEHSLQLLLTALVAVGLLDLVEDDRVRPWFLAALALGPLVRFENASLMLMGVVILAVRRRWRVALTVFALSTAALAGFVLFLTGLGLPPLPSSVLIKLGSTTATGPIALLAELAENVLEGIAKPRMLVVFAALYLFWRRWRVQPDAERRSRDGLYALFLGGVVGAHALVGRYDWFGRYEVYIFLAAAIVLLPAFRADLAALLAARRRWALAGLAFAALIVGDNQIEATVGSPLAANDIYRMHWQMHRLAVDYWQGPVGVNDVGWVSLDNPHYVLDLWGQASETARNARLGSTSYEWADALAAERGVDLLILFDRWFPGPKPPGWQWVGQLHLAGPEVQIIKSVELYSRNPERLDEVKSALAAWAATLPRGAELRLSEAG